ncbi:hypothetical protein NIES37_46400 [Tolypothrix tenuis PCC 7101]|uniref:YcfA family protein n=1 Tax=Tolypothrix tenuis PCC 7101 TaxID=231146 RepID=A0A1Z4N4P7_9CYAN|nr:type II toxin-antitoxin system HicA family toxin [Aulosira sp. FACHB-113]BAZ00645.1 hypothetical protein NIES37_46400 [Tolypothrix tenuis PCC 7101]BAZ75432.1 hypothetical protein NIES50_40150 [Aulosira laxa NIES-50]
MIRDIQFNELEKLLLNIGFAKVPTTGNQQVYQSSPSGALIILPAYEQQDYVQSVHLVAVRRVLLENGLINTNTFNRFLEKVAS